MLYIETLRAVCKPARQEPLQVVTLLNYPGEVFTEKHCKGWAMMGPGRLIETTWINVSRAPRILGYYAFDQVNFPDDIGGCRPTLETLRTLAAKVFEPYGPMIRQLEVAPRRIAVLSSEASRLYNKSPGLLGYPNYQPYHFYTVLAMAHLNADVVFDETIERYGLDAYDVLVLPKCDVLTKTVYEQVLAFQKRGGMVIADQYLGPSLSEAMRFDFDFTYRQKVSANAIATGKIYLGAGQDDHIIPGKSEMTAVKGVTARQDQLIMESHAARLRKELKGKVEPDVWCDRHDVLINVLEKHGVRYLVVFNDKRTHDERTGPFKGIMEKLESQTVTIHVRRGKETPVAYDLVKQERLDLKQTAEVLTVPVELGELGGTIVALGPAEIARVTVAAPKRMMRNHRYALRIRLVDARRDTGRTDTPLRVVIKNPGGKKTEYSRYGCASNGNYVFDLLPALNDPLGVWTMEVTDLTAGRSVTQRFEVVDNPSGKYH